MADNLPPGCSINDIPGNRPEDIAWEKFYDTIAGDSSFYGMTDMDALWAWKAGLAVYRTARDWQARFPHDPTDSAAKPTKGGA